jgi:CRP-like cAMP-binding protein
MSEFRTTDLLRALDIFKDVPSEDLTAVAGVLHERRLAEGQVLYRQAEAADALYIVIGGRIRTVSVARDGREEVRAHYTDGQLFGEMALLASVPPSSLGDMAAGVRPPG